MASICSSGRQGALRCSLYALEAWQMGYQARPHHLKYNNQTAAGRGSGRLGVAAASVVAALMCEVPPKRRRHITHRAASRCCRSRSSFGWGTSTILVSDVDVVAALICEVPPKRRRHLTHRAASRRHRSRSSFGWRTSTLFRRRGCLSRARPCDDITSSSPLAVVVASAPGTIDTTTTTTATTAGTTTTMTDSTASSCGHGCTLIRCCCGRK